MFFFWLIICPDVIAGLSSKLTFALKKEMANQVRHDKVVKTEIATSLPSSQ